MKGIRCRKLYAVIIGVFFLFTAGLAVADIILYPGYISGTVTVGNFNVYSANVSAYGGGYSSSKSVTGNTYTLTVQGGDWDYTVNASTQLRPVDAYYPNTYMTFNPRTFPVAVGQTVTNDYSVTPGIVQFQVTITGDPYTSWTANGYATKNLPSPGERTSSQGYTNSSYSPNGSWDMPVVPNEQIRIYARVRVDNKYYYFWSSSPDLRYEDIAAGQTLVIPLNVQHEAYVPPDPLPPPLYGSVQGSIFLNIGDPASFSRHRIRGYRSVNSFTNPGDYFLGYEGIGNRYYRAYTWFDEYRTYLQWPCTDGDCSKDLITVEANQAYTKDFYSDTGTLRGQLKFSGTLSNDDLTSYALSAYGAYRFYDPVNGWVPQITYGGYASISKRDSDPDINYRFYLTPGPWLPYYVSASRSRYSGGYYTSYSASIYDYSHYYDGYSYDYGQPSTIVAGETLVQDREYCMGSVVVRWRDDAGGLLSSPTARGTANLYNESNDRVLYARLYGSSGVQNVATPEVEIHGPTGDYILSNLWITAGDGSRISFPSFPIALECGVRKGVPISGVPKIVITHPPAYLVTNASSVTVTGTAADDTGIARVTINGTTVDAPSTGNPDNEVAFSHVLSLADGTLAEGTNTIVTNATDPEGHLSYDERDIYVDRWAPTVTIESPADGEVTVPDTAVPVNVKASDQGFGFSLKVYVSGSPTFLCEVDGPENEAAPETVLCDTTLLSTTEDQVIVAVVTDRAGNSASSNVTLRGNSPPTVSAGGPYTVDEGGSVVLTATGSDPENDILTYAWDLDGDGIFEPLGQSATFSAVAIDGPSSHPVSVRVTDSGGLTATSGTTVTVNNVAPTVDAGPDATIFEAGTFVSSGSFVDPGPDTWTATVDYGDGTGSLPLDLNGKTFGLNHTYFDDGRYTVTVTVTDDDGGIGSDTAIVTVQNVAPTATFALARGTINEGESVAVAFSDPDDPGPFDRAAGYYYAYDCTNDGTDELSSAVDTSFACAYPDNGTFTIRGRITDKDGGFTDYLIQVTVDNVAPSVGNITAAIDPTAVGTAIQASAAFTDPGVLDTHTAAWDWGDGITSPGTINEANGSGTASGSHAYAAAGVYTVTVTVTDKDGGSGQSVFEYIVVYDPSEGFVTGGGWIDSPEGAYALDATLTGKANFGFVSKYKKGATEPTGNTQFNFRAASLNFHSSAYQWLVVAGAKTKFKGSGTMNGTGTYGFLLTATDGQLSGEGIDTFRIKIWDAATGTIVYDNQMGDPDDADAVDAIDGGSIVIHGN